MVRQYLAFCIVLLFIVSCGNGSSDSSTAKKYENNTELFLDYELGMTKEDFYDQSWKLNDKGLVKQGPSNQSVYYKLDNELDHPTQMYFYPSFYKDRVYQMRIRFEYKNWAPWNKNLYADSLQVEVLKLFEEWYGDGFVRKETKKNKQIKSIYVKRDGNRQITVTTRGSQNVVAFITDVVASKEMQSSQDQNSDDS